MQQRAGEIHKEALKNGDAYAIVWFDPNGEVTIYPQRAANVVVTMTKNVRAAFYGQRNIGERMISGRG